MKFERIRADRFGALTGWDTGEEALPGFVVVEGPNEAGKSSIHALLSALLFGFDPANREQNPWTPWGGGDIEIHASYRSSDSPPVEVRRRLLSSPRGERVVGELVESLANRNLPEVEHVTRKVFEQIYALRLSDLAGLGREGHGAIRNRLVVGMGTTDLHPPREVAGALGDEAERLWSRNRRRNTPHKALQERLTELRRARRGAEERDGELRRNLERIAELGEELEAVEVRLAEGDEAAALRPLALRLAAIGALEERVGDEGELEGLPAEPRSRLEELTLQVDRLRKDAEELEGEGARLREEGEERDEAGERIRRESTRIRRLAADLPAFSLRREERARVDATVDQLTREVEERVRPLVADPEAPLTPDPFLDLPVGELEDRVADLEALRSRVASAEEGVRAAEARPLPSPPSGLLGVGGVLFVVGAVAAGVVAGTILEPPIPAPVLGVVGSAVILGVVLLLSWWMRRRMHREGVDAREAEVRQARSRIDTLRNDEEGMVAAARELLAPLPLREELVRAPRMNLVRELRELREGLLARKREVQSRSRMDQELDRVGREVESLRQAGIPVGSSDPLHVLQELARALDEADDRAGKRAEALRKAGEVEERLGRLREDLAASAGELTTLRDRIDAAGGVDRVTERLMALDRLRGNRLDLAEEFPDWRERLSAIEALDRSTPGWRSEDGGSETVHLRTRAGELRSAIAELETENRGLLEEPTIDGIEGEIRFTEEEMAVLRRERDRRFVLERLIQVAERRFREAHQPDLLRRAEGYMASISHGRYDRLLLADGEGDFLVRIPETGHDLPIAEPLSTGTREQIYLALRLAIVDHLDEGRERLPLFLDEVLVNWDPERRSRGLELFGKAARERQIFLFTCHPELAREAEAHGARRLPLPGPGGR